MTLQTGSPPIGVWESIKGIARRIFGWGERRQPVSPISTVTAPPAPESTRAKAEPAPRQQPAPRGLRRKIEDAANDILDRFAESARDDKTPGTIGTYINAHSDLWGCDYHLVDELAEDCEGASRFYLVTGDAHEQTESVWPVDFATLVPKENDEYFMARISSVSSYEVRGKVKVAPPKMLVLSHGQLTEHRTWWAQNTLCGLIGGEWTDIGNTIVSSKGNSNYTRSKSDATEIKNTIAISLAAVLTARYSWHVALGSGVGGPRLVLPTNPTGCLALFRDRDAPENGRRAALRHWVANHYRDSSISAADIIYVRDHLRGATQFNWRGLQCELMVSQFDLEKNDFFRLQAAEWRSQRKHNRVRLRMKDRIR
ncbi:MAG: hypothetical protein FJ271_22875 [Planctomycetes bacterium]|nr:hypothetical protein [Planctomycetota bacterium]